VLLSYSSSRKLCVSSQLPFEAAESFREMTDHQREIQQRRWSDPLRPAPLLLLPHLVSLARISPTALSRLQHTSQATLGKPTASSPPSSAARAGVC